jgi:anti-sigma factor RsiW
MTACPDKLLLLQAHVDRELDAASTLALEAHLRSCTDCAEELDRIETLGVMMARANLAFAAPAALRSRVEGMVAAPAPRAPDDNTPAFVVPVGNFRAIARSWGSGLVTGLVLSLAVVLALPQFTRRNTEDELVANHIRSLSLDSHLTDVATSDRHVVKPWFNGKIDFAPPVPELSAQGFPLIGGRLDYVDGHQVAAIVYKRRLHTINVFVQPAGSLSLPLGISTKHDGFSLVRWTNAGLEFWAVSDIDLGDMQQFRRAFEGQPSL